MDMVLHWLVAGSYSSTAFSPRPPIKYIFPSTAAPEHSCRAVQVFLVSRVDHDWPSTAGETLNISSSRNKTVTGLCFFMNVYCCFSKIEKAPIVRLLLGAYTSRKDAIGSRRLAL